MTTIQVRPGVGGEEALAWAGMLLEMYACWAGRNGVEIVMRAPGVIVLVGVHPDLAREVGVHRLVRVSPFDPEKRRHTSFASVSVSFSSDNTQLRSYTLDPYESVKDYRTGREGKPAEVLEGDLSFLDPPAPEPAP